MFSQNVSLTYFRKVASCAGRFAGSTVSWPRNLINGTQEANLDAALISLPDADQTACRPIVRNRREKVFNTEVLRLCRGGLELCMVCGGLSPPNTPWRRDCYHQASFSSGQTCTVADEYGRATLGMIEVIQR